jgi:hypothetical protein
LEVLVDYQSAIVDQAIVMDGIEDITIDILVSSSDEHSALELQFILLPLLFEDNGLSTFLTIAVL